MSDTIIVAIISAAVTLGGTIITIITTAISNRRKTILRIDDVDKKLDSHIQEEEWANAKQCRTRILRFNDEICRGVKFSENHFEDILEDIDAYEAFCEKHKNDYHNGKGKLAMDNIKETYKRDKLNNDFLK